MRILNDYLQELATVAAGQNSNNQPLDHMMVADVTATITAANPSNKTFISGVAEVQTLTFPAKAAATGGDYIVIYDTTGQGWAVWLDKSGSDTAPTGALYASLAAANKARANISADSTAATVAARAKTALNALTGFTAVITLDDSANDGTMTSTQALRAPVTDPIPHSANDGGAGSISGVETTAGVLTKVDLTANTATIASHGFATGMKFQLTTSSALPTGLSTSTDYYAIVVDADTIKFASSQANALAGTAIDLTGYGTGTQTVAVTTTIAGSIKLQKNNEPSSVDPVWFDITSSSQSFTGTTNLNWAITDIGYRSIRAVAAVTSGTVTVVARINAKGV